MTTRYDFRDQDYIECLEHKLEFLAIYADELRERVSMPDLSDGIAAAIAFHADDVAAIRVLDLEVEMLREEIAEEIKKPVQATA